VISSPIDLYSILKGFILIAVFSTHSGFSAGLKRLLKRIRNMSGIKNTKMFFGEYNKLTILKSRIKLV